MSAAAVHSHAASRRADLRRIGWGYRGDTVGELQPGLQIADTAVVLDALDGERLGGQAEKRQQVGRKLPLKREIMDCHHGRRFDRAGVVQIGR